jgi:hypothetical protein
LPNPPPSKEKLREKIDSDLAAFVRNGGKITQIDKGVMGAKPKKYGTLTNLGKKPRND